MSCTNLANIYTCLLRSLLLLRLPGESNSKCKLLSGQALEKNIVMWCCDKLADLKIPKWHLGLISLLTMATCSPCSIIHTLLLLLRPSILLEEKPRIHWWVMERFSSFLPFFLYSQMLSACQLCVKHWNTRMTKSSFFASPLQCAWLQAWLCWGRLPRRQKLWPM